MKLPPEKPKPKLSFQLAELLIKRRNKRNSRFLFDIWYLKFYVHTFLVQGMLLRSQSLLSADKQKAIILGEVKLERLLI